MQFQYLIQDYYILSKAVKVNTLISQYNILYMVLMQLCVTHNLVIHKQQLVHSLLLI